MVVCVLIWIWGFVFCCLGKLVLCACMISAMLIALVYFGLLVGLAVVVLFAYIDYWIV